MLFHEMSKLAKEQLAKQPPVTLEIVLAQLKRMEEWRTESVKKQRATPEADDEKEDLK